MNARIVLGAVLGAAGLIVLGQYTVGADTGNQAPGGLANENTEPEFIATGDGEPDVYCLKVDGLSNWEQGDYRAYSVGTTSCNQGTAVLRWEGGNSWHPVIGQAMYRLMPDPVHGHPRMEQIGQSWLKHGFCALDQNECGSCQGTGCSSLGIGCSDPYTSGRNGSQGSAGPKYQVDATTGIFPYPPADPSYSGAVARRPRALKSDVLPASNPGARYFLEAQYVHPEDSPATTSTGVAGNNASYREVQLNGTGVATSYIGLTVKKFPAVTAWPGAIQRIAIASEGTVRIAYAAYDNGDGTWDYEYAVHNLDFDRSVGSFSVPVDDSVTVTNIDFHDVDYHSGEPYDGTDWPGTHAGGAVTWETTPHSVNEDANAIRWGTLYNFRFTADVGPADQNMASQVGAFKPGTTNSWNAAVAVPDVSAGCAQDVDGDGMVGFTDLLEVLSFWGPCPGGCAQDIDGDEIVGFSDLLEVLSFWGPC